MCSVSLQDAKLVKNGSTSTPLEFQRVVRGQCFKVEQPANVILFHWKLLLGITAALALTVDLIDYNIPLTLCTYLFTLLCEV